MNQFFAQHTNKAGNLVAGPFPIYAPQMLCEIADETGRNQPKTSAQ